MDFSRRTFMKIAAIGGTSLATGSGIKKVGKLVPYVVPPEKMSPVEWHTLATTCRECPAGCGMHIRHRDGRITKAEGIPDHPVNRGGLCPRGQSALQGVYDPDRVSTVHARYRRSDPFRQETWQKAFAKIGERMQKGRVAVMSRLETGTLAEIMSAFAGGFGPDRLLFYEAFDYDPLRKANAELFGRSGIPYYHLDQAEYILSFGADFLESWVSNVQFAWQFAQMHELKDGKIGRFDYVGPRLSMTAANADKFIAATPARTKEIALGMLRVMIDQNRIRAGESLIAPLFKNADVGSVLASPVGDEIRTMVKRFVLSRSVALAGPVAAAGPEAEQLALIVSLMNTAEGAGRSMVDFSRLHALSNTGTEDQVAAFLKSLTSDDVLIIHKTNPVYTRPGSEELIKQAGLIVYLGTMLDETASIADWYLPVHDDLESWGDYEPWTGIQSLMQPTMRTLTDSIDAGEVLIRLAAAQKKVLRTGPDGTPVRTTRDWLRERWRSKVPHADWENVLRKGGSWAGSDSSRHSWLNQPAVAGSKPVESDSPSKRLWIPVSAGIAKIAAVAAKASAPELNNDEAHLWLWPSIMLFDGRTANRGWIQEAPEPVSTLTWGSWIDIHPGKAQLLGIRDGEVIELVSKENRSIEAPRSKLRGISILKEEKRSYSLANPAASCGECAHSRIQAPARITREVAEDTVALPFGQGHTALGANAANLGANAFSLLPVGKNFEGYFGRVTIRKTGRSEDLVPGMTTTEQHDRELLQWKRLDEARTMKPGPLILPLAEGYTRERDLYRHHEHKNYRWAMSIDLQRCIGCGACAVACYAENNIPVVGKRRVREGRHLPWLRVVPYRHHHDPLRIAWLPMLCQHCDSAPCEPVCPVYAAVNNEEGLNAQIYNRCIGTRYCSNNCPYKVRRFNWLNIQWKKPLTWQLNPEVTVRVRGIMEKCTFCIQRIRNAESRAKKENRKVRDGEVLPACVQSCPAKVFTFGNLLDPNSQISRITRNHPRRYHVLEELNTKPAVTYLFRILQEERSKT